MPNPNMLVQHFMIKDACESILAKRFGSKIQLDLNLAIDSSPHSNIVRFLVPDGSSELPAKLIAKQTVIGKDDTIYESNAESFGSAQRLFNEWASLSFLNEQFSGQSLAPKFYGGDRSLGLTLMEDLSDGETLIIPLSGNDPAAAEVALVGHMQMLGRLHAGTIGKEDEYRQLRHEFGKAPAYFSPAAEDLFPPERITLLCDKTLQLLAIEPSPGLEAELAQVTSFWTDPGPFLVYTHGDPAPGNEFSRNGQRKLIDFEYGGFRHALTEGIYARMQFVTGAYVLRIPDEVVLKMEDAYRVELAKGCSIASDDRHFYRAVAEGCAYATIAMWHWAFPKILTEDEAWGISSCQQRILRRLDILAQTTATIGHLEAIGATAQSIATKLRSIWPSEADSMPYYPAFR